MINHMQKKEDFIQYLLSLADTHLILSQRNAEWCAHGPILEQDIAITNITLDLLGQARNLYQYAAQLMDNGATEDSLAYLRTEREFKNILLVEFPKVDWAQTILRQFVCSVYQQLLWDKLSSHPDATLAAIANKSIKETNYHVKWSSEWVIRLGDGTAESHQRMLKAIENCWPYTDEMFMPASYEANEITGIDIRSLKADWEQTVKEVFEEATLPYPSKVFMHSGGKQGNHTEHLGYILAEMQTLQRTYPGAEW
jgi:ring-1,2-phenylacetyl-CoA epoxidase subunit PaaC